MSEEATLRLAQAAEAMLNNDAVQEAKRELVDGYLKQIRESGPFDYDKREECYRLVATVDALFGQLHVYHQRGKQIVAKREKARKPVSPWGVF